MNSIRNLVRTYFVKYSLLTIIVGMIATMICGLLKMPTQTSDVIVIVIIVMSILIWGLKTRKVKIDTPAYIEKQNDNCSVFGRIIEIAAYLSIIVQIIVSVIYTSNSTFTDSYIKYATIVYEGGPINIKAPLMSFWGIISNISGVHPLILVHTFLAVYLIILAYESYILLAIEIFKDDDSSVYIAILCISLINIYGYWSDKAMPFTLLLGYFTLAGFLIHVVLINAALYAIRKSEEAKVIKIEENNFGADLGDDYQEEWDMKKHKIINARNLAIGLGVIVLMLAALAYTLNNKINSLYEVTVNLQMQMDSGCKMYEFAPNGENEGYVIKNSDGTLTVIGGGSAENGDALCDFIKKYGDSVDTWYVYGSDEENFGAYQKCTNEKGINVDNIYELTRSDVNN